MTPFAARVLHPGAARGECLVLDETLSFWGGYAPDSGRIIDRNHPQNGASTAGAILVLPGSRGSAGTPAGVAESLRCGAGPAGFILLHADVNITVGAMVAGRLYAMAIPVLVAPPADYARLATGMGLTIDIEGNVFAQ